MLTIIILIVSIVITAKVFSGSKPLAIILGFIGIFLILDTLVYALLAYIL